MVRYKRDLDLNRDALFASSAGGGQESRQYDTQKSPSRSDGVIESLAINTSKMTTSRERSGKGRITTAKRLEGSAKLKKMSEAEEYRKKAKKSMQRTLFSSPDPIAGGMFYHRAAEAYKVCGENRLERLHRIASADCQMGHNAFATAATEYVRAAELSEISDEKDERKKSECTKLFSDAAKAWREEGELARSAECMLRSGFSLLIGDGDEMIGTRRLQRMNQNAVETIEEAIECHVPDPLNRYMHFRQTGTSAFVDPESEETENQETCMSYMVKSSFAHEVLNQAVNKFVEYGNYKSALYAAGSVSAYLENDGFSTISLSRAYCVETVLTLAVGDVVAADKAFLEVHLQNSNYLSSRECKLSEDLIRAIKNREIDDLECARDVNGENRAALNNLDASLRDVVANLRISGEARKSNVSASQNVESTKPLSTSTPEASQAPLATGGDNLLNEMDDLMNDMGLGSDDDDDDDDDLDLR